MTTITIKDANLSKTDFLNTNDLLNYLLNLYSSNIEYEELSQEENKIINNLKFSHDFKNAVKNLKI